MTKGSRQRPYDRDSFNESFDRIFNNDKKKRKSLISVNKGKKSNKRRS